MQERLAAKPDLTLRALLGELRDRGIGVSYFALWNIVRRSEITFKKRPCTPASKNAPMSPADASSGGARNIA